MKLTISKLRLNYRLLIGKRLNGDSMGVSGIWLASASERRTILLEELISKSDVETFLVSAPLIEDEINPKHSTLKETVFSITKMKMQNALLEISLGRLETLNFNDAVNDFKNIITIVSDTLVEDPDSFEQVFGKRFSE